MLILLCNSLIMDGFLLFVSACNFGEEQDMNPSLAYVLVGLQGLYTALF